MKVDGNRFRAKRFKTFLNLLDRTGITTRPIRILDIGGTESYWCALEALWAVRQLDITLVNLDVKARDEGIFHHRTGDATALEYADNAFDVVHSNSVIEHVGHWPEMVKMAGEVRRLAPHYYLQTPNFWFPVEPHYRSLFFHWLPESTRAAKLVQKQRGFRTAPDFDTAMRDIQTVVLLTADQMGVLFPDGKLVREKVGPFTKSLVMVR
jgi:2-polyprenyl-3-methyl-5-hydroxy-6-metoxy-1,4-benzoquinol methylase